MLMAGTEWIVDATGCDPVALCDAELLRGLFERIVEDLGLHVVDARWHQFPEPGGITGFALLSESHLACHTYPEFGLATINLYCCRERAAWDWEGQLAASLGARSVAVRVVERPAQGVAEETLEVSASKVSADSVSEMSERLVSGTAEDSVSSPALEGSGRR
ncbi:MAG TPA: adenosylmethionine decarboxylase [Pyrinomonadaceae bacterium]|jgi:S-adenosylmethionine decarboxylase